MISGPGVRSGQRAIYPFIEVYISLTRAAEISGYVPSSVVGAGRVCASAAATNPQNPIIDNSPIYLCMRLRSFKAVLLLLCASGLRSRGLCCRGLSRLFLRGLASAPFVAPFDALSAPFFSPLPTLVAAQIRRLKSSMTRKIMLGHLFPTSKIA